MSLRSALSQIVEEYPEATTQGFSGHKLSGVIKGEARQAVADALGRTGADLLVRGSPGQGTWAEVPWISIFDPLVTSTAMQGYYVVYLFHAEKPLVHLSLNQGTTEVQREFGRTANQVLAERAVFMRHRLADYVTRFPIHAIDLGSSRPLPSGYAAGHALGVTYDLEVMPDDAALRHDVQGMVEAYRTLTFRGGLNSSSGRASAATTTDLLEERRYQMHRRIERNPHATKLARKHHGLRCQACDLVMAKKYGAPGEDFIEVHHLRPLASLQEGQQMKYDVALDFAVLCPNCHRMIHRMDDPSDISALRKLLQAV